MYSNASDPTAGNFSVSVHANNAPLNVTFVDVPVATRLEGPFWKWDAHRKVVFHRTYEGNLVFQRFKLRSTSPLLTDECNQDAEDAAGHRRTKQVEANDGMAGLEVERDIPWDDATSMRGYVYLDNHYPLVSVL